MTLDHSPTSAPRSTGGPTRRRPHVRGARATTALAAMALALAGCGGQGTSSTSATTATSQATAAGQSGGQATSAATQAAAATPTLVASASAPTVDRSTAHPQGQLVDLRVPGLDPRLEPVKVWLPPQYFEAAHKDERFPVLLGIGAMHASGESFVKTTDALQVARTAIQQGKAKPFIGVYLPSRIDLDVDSECVDLPGLAAQSFYTQQVVQAVRQAFATVAPGKGWYTEGYSTGGQCAALLQARHPDVFTASVSMAGYFTPLYDAAAQKLATPALTAANSPLAMVKAGTLKRLDLLSIASTKDKDSWGTPGAVAPAGEGDGAQFHAVAKDLPGISFLMAQTSGHSRTGYLPYWTPAIDWLGARGL